MKNNKVLFRIKCIKKNNMDFYTEGKIYDFIESKGILADDNEWVGAYKNTFKKWQEISVAEWELVEEQTLLGKFYDLLGVEDAEPFHVKEGCWL